MGIVDLVAQRLAAAELTAPVRDIRPVGRGGVETALVSLSSDTPAAVRRQIADALAGLAFECVEDARPIRGTVRDGVGVKDGRTWRLGTGSDVAWIRDGTRTGLTIESAIPPRFEAYATVLIGDDDVQRRAAEPALVHLLVERSGSQPWWLGYLDTGAHDVVFDRAPRVKLYWDWPYVLVQAGPEQAAAWRDDDAWRGRLPDLVFPADRSWLVSMLWDDDWRCLGGPVELIDAVLAEPALQSRRVRPGEDATPPGFTAR